MDRWSFFLIWYLFIVLILVLYAGQTASIVVICVVWIPMSLYGLYYLFTHRHIVPIRKH
jgi:hypothetical protein